MQKNLHKTLKPCHNQHIYSIHVATSLLHIEQKNIVIPNETVAYYTELILVRLQKLENNNSQCNWTFRIRYTSCNTAEQ